MWFFGPQKGLFLSIGCSRKLQSDSRAEAHPIDTRAGAVEAHTRRSGEERSSGGGDNVGEDEYERAKAIVIEANRASISMLQQRMGVGYNHASRIIDLLERRGVVGPHRGAGPREVLATE